MGHAIRFGLDHATSDIGMVVMGDGSDDLRILGDLYNKVGNEGYDLAIGSRYRMKENLVNVPFLYKFFSRIYCYTCHLLLGIYIKDFTNGYRAFNWKKLKTIGLEGKAFEISPEITFKCWQFKKSIVEVDSKHQKRLSGSSKFSFLKTAFPYGKMMLKAFFARVTGHWIRIAPS